MIVKEKGGWSVKSEKGKNLGGPYKSRAQAKKRLAEVEKFKHMNKSVSSYKTQSPWPWEKSIPDQFYYINEGGADLAKTSEGARKAWETRRSGGSRRTEPFRSGEPRFTKEEEEKAKQPTWDSVQKEKDELIGIARAHGIEVVDSSYNTLGIKDPEKKADIYEGNVSLKFYPTPVERAGQPFSAPWTNDQHKDMMAKFQHIRDQAKEKGWKVEPRALPNVLIRGKSIGSARAGTSRWMPSYYVTYLTKQALMTAAPQLKPRRQMQLDKTLYVVLDLKKSRED